VRRVRYRVASSVDGYIAGPKGEFDWIIRDPEIDFGALFAQFDTFLMGRKTYELVVRSDHPAMPGARTFVFSRTLRQPDCAGVTVVADRVKETIASLRADAGKDIWLFGGGSLAARRASPCPDLSSARSRSKIGVARHPMEPSAYARFARRDCPALGLGSRRLRMNTRRRLHQDDGARW